MILFYGRLMNIHDKYSYANQKALINDRLHVSKVSSEADLGLLQHPRWSALW